MEISSGKPETRIRKNRFCARTSGTIDADKIVYDQNGGTNMSEKEKKELDEIITRCHITKDDLYMEAECVEEYGEWMHMPLMGYSADSLREAAERMAK